jgi:hypothetical protein
MHYATMHWIGIETTRTKNEERRTMHVLCLILLDTLRRSFFVSIEVSQSSVEMLHTAFLANASVTLSFSIWEYVSYL